MRRLISIRPTIRCSLVAVLATSSALLLGGSAFANGPDDDTAVVPAVTSPLASPTCRAEGASTLLVPTEGDSFARLSEMVDVASWLASQRAPIVVACASVALDSEGSSCELDDQTVAVLWPDQSGRPSPTPFAELAEALDEAGSAAGVDPGAGDTFRCRSGAPAPPAGSPNSPSDGVPTTEPFPQNEQTARPPASDPFFEPSTGSPVSAAVPPSTQAASDSSAANRQRSLQPLSSAPISDTSRRSGPALAGVAALVTAGLWHVGRREPALP